MDSLQGYLLVASPKMGDPTFNRTVVLMVQHNEEGAFGIVLNRPTNNTVKELWDKLGAEPCDIEQPVDFGGPVSGPLIALHSDSTLGEVQIPPGVFLAAEKDHLDHLVKQANEPFRLFIGHAGWGEGQLEGELDVGAWFTTPAKPEHIFVEHEDLWASVIQQIGHTFLKDVLHLKHIPDDASLN